MCGCMLSHATMDHTREQPVVQSRGLDTASGTGTQRCKHCGFPVDQDFPSALAAAHACKRRRVQLADRKLSRIGERVGIADSRWVKHGYSKRCVHWEP